MEIGIDSFAAAKEQNLSQLNKRENSESLSQLLGRIEYADKQGLDVFGIGSRPGEYLKRIAERIGRDLDLVRMRANDAL